MKNDLNDNRRMYDVLQAPDRLRNEVKGPRGMLAHLWRTILMERNIGLASFDAATAHYIRKERSSPSSSRIRNFLSKSAIFRDMSQPTMTWVKLIRGLQILDIRRIEVRIKLHGRYKTTVHECQYDLINNGQFADVDDDDESPISKSPPKAADTAGDA